MKEIKTVLFRIISSGKVGHETNETMKRKLEEYKELLKKEYKIIGEKEVENRRGKFIEITYK